MELKKNPKKQKEAEIDMLMQTAVEDVQSSLLNGGCTALRFELFSLNAPATACSRAH